MCLSSFLKWRWPDMADLYNGTPKSGQHKSEFIPICFFGFHFGRGNLSFVATLIYLVFCKSGGNYDLSLSARYWSHLFRALSRQKTGNLRHLKDGGHHWRWGGSTSQENLRHGASKIPWRSAAAKINVDSQLSDDQPTWRGELEPGEIAPSPLPVKAAPPVWHSALRLAELRADSCCWETCWGAHTQTGSASSADGTMCPMCTMCRCKAGAIAFTVHVNWWNVAGMRAGHQPWAVCKVCQLCQACYHGLFGWNERWYCRRRRIP